MSFQRATRSICGLCSKEQPIANKECCYCGQEFVKEARHFWEGGQGCRDKVRLDRRDPKKFKDSFLKVRNSEREK